MRRGPDGNIYVLDSRNFAIRLIDLKTHVVKTIAGMGKTGYDGDNGDALNATFGSSPAEKMKDVIQLEKEMTIPKSKRVADYREAW